jgi:hypothetical protein
VVLTGVYEAGAGSVVFTGTGTAGDAVYIVGQPGSSSRGNGVVGANGTFSVAGSTSAMSAGDTVEAHAGSATGPVSAPITLVAAGGALATGSSQTNGTDSGATVITVSGNPGETITIVDTSVSPAVDLGSAVVGSNGQAAVNLTAPVSGGTTLEILSNGVVESSFSVAATAGSAPVVTQGAVLVEGSVLTGTGTVGSLIQVVDDLGHVLGSGTVASDGTWSVPVSGAVAGAGVKVIQDGVETRLPSAQALGAETAFTNVNVFKPALGGSLDIGVKALADGKMTVRIFDVAGEAVRVVAFADVRAGLLYAFKWNGRNEDGETVAAGLYVISVQGGGVNRLRKVVVLK